MCTKINCGKTLECEKKEDKNPQCSPVLAFDFRVMELFILGRLNCHHAEKNK